MLTDYFADAIYPEGSREEKLLIGKILQSSLEGNLCVAIESGGLPESLVAENPEEDLPARPFCRFGKNYYLQKSWVFETRFLKEIDRLLKPVEELDSFCLDGLNAEQQEAVRLALRSGLMIITGGPGTGKTYTARQIVQSFLLARPRSKVVLAAQTGKAASRLESVLPGSSCTLHQLLKVRSSSDYIEESCRIEADLVIVDECSMVDAALFSRLLASIPQGTRVILMGDADQLPPVESGSLFADLVASGKVPCVRFVKSLRTKQQGILALADAVNRGDVEEALKVVEPLDVWKEVEAHYPGPFLEEPNPEKLLIQMERFKILSCLRKGKWGVDTLNEEIFTRIWKNSHAGQWVAAPIIIVKNDPETGLFNGDSGVLVRRYPSLNEGVAYFSKKQLPLCLLPPFEYAYALSVHKSQGSEYDKVVLLVPTGSEAFGREVLYTAITRAKESLQIDGDKEIITAALNHTSKRRSGLRERLIC